MDMFDTIAKANSYSHENGVPFVVYVDNRCPNKLTISRKSIFKMEDVFTGTNPVTVFHDFIQIMKENNG